MIRLLLTVLATILAAGLLAGALPGSARGQSALPEGPGRDAVEGVCTACHSASQITRSSGFLDPRLLMNDRITLQMGAA